VLGFLRNSVRELGQTVVMVTHDPVAAAYADRVVFLADGRLVDELYQPSSEAVLDFMRQFPGGGNTSGSAARPQTPEFDAKGRTR
jgi:putative ABC transport system ATP-binding protein